MKRLLEFLKNLFINNWSYFLTLAIILVLFLVKIPYQVEAPGGIIDLNNRVTVNGEEIDTEGSFNMAYVTVVQGSIPYALLSFVIPDWDLVKNDEVMNKNETVEDSNKRDRLYLEQSKNYAIVAALETAKMDYKINNKINHVVAISEKSNNNFKIGDYILKVEDKELYDINELSDIVSKTDIGTTLHFVVMRDDKEVETEATVYLDDDNKRYIGVSIITTFDIESELDIDISTKSSESGPSGGMMMALMTYNAITKDDLTRGKKIVGTGTISLDGTVGPIGGIKYKLMGAVKNDADIFLVPDGENYEEALKVKEEKKYDIDIVPVKTLNDAIVYLEGI